MAIHIKTKLPGPKALKIIERDKKYISPSYTRDPHCPVVIASGEGAYVTDVDGNVFLDFCAGIAVTSTGHSHREVVKAISEQGQKFIHMSGTDFYYDVQSRLAEKLSDLAPGKENKKVFFSNSGAEAIECALKLARYHTRRKQFIAFFGSFHGRTYGALSLTSSKPVQKENFFPFVPGVTHIPYPNIYRASRGMSENEVGDRCLDYLKNTVFKTLVPVHEVAAVFMEPVQGEGGYVIPPKKFMKDLVALCKENGILFVADEVQAGMGRTGKMFASSHFGVEPDIICLAKGIASGLPLGATIARESVMDWKPGSHASTFGGNPISCAAALTTLDLLEKKYIKNAAEIGKYILTKLKKIETKSSLIGDVRGLGLMIGVEIVKDKKTKEPAPDVKAHIVTQAFKRGLVILGCGVSTIRFCPPLIITKKDADTALSIFEESLLHVEKS